MVDYPLKTLSTRFDAFCHNFRRLASIFVIISSTPGKCDYKQLTTAVKNFLRSLLLMLGWRGLWLLLNSTVIPSQHEWEASEGDSTILWQKASIKRRLSSTYLSRGRRGLSSVDDCQIMTKLWQKSSTVLNYDILLSYSDSKTFYTCKPQEISVKSIAI